MVYENGSPVVVTAAYFGSDGVYISGTYNGTSITVNFDEANAESSIRATLADGSTVTAARG